MVVLRIVSDIVRKGSGHAHRLSYIFHQLRADDLSQSFPLPSLSYALSPFHLPGPRSHLKVDLLTREWYRSSKKERAFSPHVRVSFSI